MSNKAHARTHAKFLGGGKPLFHIARPFYHFIMGDLLEGFTVSFTTEIEILPAANIALVTQIPLY